MHFRVDKNNPLKLHDKNVFYKSNSKLFFDRNNNANFSVNKNAKCILLQTKVQLHSGIHKPIQYCVRNQNKSKEINYDRILLIS